MHEETLKNFFQDDISLDELLKDLQDSVTESKPKSLYQHIIDMDEDFEVTTEHLVLLCDEFISGEMDASVVATIGFCMASSDHFYWDIDDYEGNVISNVIHMWASKESNHPINDVTMMQFRDYLLTGQNPFNH